MDGLIYKEVGKILGVDASTVRSWELGKSVPNNNPKQTLLVCIGS